MSARSNDELQQDMSCLNALNCVIKSFKFFCCCTCNNQDKEANTLEQNNSDLNSFDEPSRSSNVVTQQPSARTERNIVDINRNSGRHVSRTPQRDSKTSEEKTKIFVIENVPKLPSTRQASVLPGRLKGISKRNVETDVLFPKQSKVYEQPPELDSFKSKPSSTRQTARKQEPSKVDDIFHSNIEPGVLFPKQSKFYEQSSELRRENLLEPQINFQQFSSVQKEDFQPNAIYKGDRVGINLLKFFSNLFFRLEVIYLMHLSIGKKLGHISTKSASAII